MTSRTDSGKQVATRNEVHIAGDIAGILAAIRSPDIDTERVGRALAAMYANTDRDLHAPTDRLAEVIAAALERDTPEPITTPVASFSQETRDYIARHSGPEGNGFDDIDVTGGGA